jgi:hypothetical protein
MSRAFREYIFTLKMETAHVGNNLPNYMASLPEYIPSF